MPRDAVAVVDARFLNARRQGLRMLFIIRNEIPEDGAHLSALDNRAAASGALANYSTRWPSTMTASTAEPRAEPWAVRASGAVAWGSQSPLSQDTGSALPIASMGQHGGERPSRHRRDLR
jgi:hypothetical protein